MCLDALRRRHQRSCISSAIVLYRPNLSNTPVYNECRVEKYLNEMICGIQRQIKGMGAHRLNSSTRIRKNCATLCQETLSENTGPRKTKRDQVEPMIGL